MKKKTFLSLSIVAVLFFVGITPVSIKAMSDTPPSVPQALEAEAIPLNEALLGKRWQLKELRGKPVQQQGNAAEKFPYMILKADGSVGGFGGCNSFGGNVIERPQQHIQFSEIFSTMMACMETGEIERNFFDVLNTADNYKLLWGGLQLHHRSQKAPLAIFVLAGEEN